MIICGFRIVRNFSSSPFIYSICQLRSCGHRWVPNGFSVRLCAIASGFRSHRFCVRRFPRPLPPQFECELRKEEGTPMGKSPYAFYDEIAFEVPYGSMPHEIISFSAAGTRRPNTFTHFSLSTNKHRKFHWISFAISFIGTLHLTHADQTSALNSVRQQWKWEIFGSILVHKTHVKAAGRMHSYFIFPARSFIHIYDFRCRRRRLRSELGYTLLTSEYSLIEMAVACGWVRGRDDRKSGGEDSRKEYILLRFLFIAFEIVFV